MIIFHPANLRIIIIIMIINTGAVGIRIFFQEKIMKTQCGLYNFAYSVNLGNDRSPINSKSWCQNTKRIFNDSSSCSTYSVVIDRLFPSQTSLFGYGFNMYDFKEKASSATNTYFNCHSQLLIMLGSGKCDKLLSIAKPNLLFIYTPPSLFLPLSPTLRVYYYRNLKLYLNYDLRAIHIY